jgi:RNA polymerase sigma-70 factor (ECF subfamily)
VLEPIEMIDERPRPDELIGQQQLRQGLEAALATIDPMYREVLLMRDVEGMTAPEVATTLELSVAAVTSRLHRARGMLRDRIEKMFDLPPPQPQIPLAEGRELGEFLSSYLEGDLTKTQCAELEAHLAGSPDCQGACDLLRRILGECRACQRDKPPERLQQSIQGAIRAVITRP